MWRERFNNDSRVYAGDFGDHRCPDVIAAKARQQGIDGMPYWGNVTLAPYTALILSQD